MHLSNGTRWMLRIGTAITLAFIYIPLIVIAIYAFNESRSQSWPIDGLHDRVVLEGVPQPGRARRALDLAQGRPRRHGDRAVLGTLAALAVSRYRFFGRERSRSS